MSDKPSPPARQPGIEGGSGASAGDLRAYVAIVRRRKWSLILVLLITVAAAAAFSYRQTPMYLSTESVQVKPLNPDQALQGSYSYNFGISMTTEQALALSPAVATLAQQSAEAAGVTSPDNGSVDANVTQDTPILQISYSAVDPVQARDWAHAYAQGYILYRTQQAAADIASVRQSIMAGSLGQDQLVL